MKKSAFVTVFGENPFVKVMDFLLENHIFDYSKTEVAKEIRISRSTIEPIWQRLIEQKIIMKTKKIGNALLYKLNTKNPIVMKMRELDFVLTNRSYVKEEKIMPISA